MTNEEQDILSKQNPDWSYRIERDTGPVGQLPGTWKITTYPSKKEYPILDYYQQELPPWLHKIVCFLDVAGDDEYVQGMGKRLGGRMYWIKDGDKEW